MTTFVLLHGAFRTPAIWDRMLPLLADHDVHRPDLTGRAATLESCIEAVTSTFERHDLTDAVLVGHSQGGFIAKAASNVLAERLRCLVYLDAPVPRHGQTAFDFRPEGTAVPDIAEGGVFESPPSTANEHLSESDATFINERRVPQAAGPSLEPVRLDDPAALSLREHFIFFADTPDFFPCAATRAHLDESSAPYAVIDGPHDAIVTDPDGVIAAITAAAGA